MKKVIIFIEGPDLSGKDTFLNYLKNIFPVYYAPTENFTEVPKNIRFSYSWKITFNTIFYSIERSNSDIAIVYRSPLTNHIYNKINDRKSQDELEYMKRVYENFDTEFLVSIPSIETIEKRYKERGDESYDLSDKQFTQKLIDEYKNTFLPYQNSYIVDNFFNVVDNIINELNEKIFSKIDKYSTLTLSDIDGVINPTNFKKLYPSINYFITGRREKTWNENNELYNKTCVKSSRFYKGILFYELLKYYSTVPGKNIFYYEDRKDIINLLFKISLDLGYNINVNKVNNYYEIGIRQ